MKKIKLFGIQLTMEKLSLNYNTTMKIMRIDLLKEEKMFPQANQISC